MKSLAEISKDYDVPIDCSHSDLYIPNSKKKKRDESQNSPNGLMDGFPYPPQHSLLTDFLVGNSWALGSLPLPWRGEGAVGPARRGFRDPPFDVWSWKSVDLKNTNLFFLLGRIRFIMFTSSVLNFLISCCRICVPNHPIQLLSSQV